MTTMTLINTGMPGSGSTGRAPLGVFQNLVPARPHTIGQAIQTAIDGLEADGLLVPFSPDDAAPFARARAVLGLLADCYARQIYNSTEVARLAGCDPDFAWPWWGGVAGRGCSPGLLREKPRGDPLLPRGGAAFSGRTKNHFGRADQGERPATRRGGQPADRHGRVCGQHGTRWGIGMNDPPVRTFLIAKQHSQAH